MHPLGGTNSNNNQTLVDDWINSQAQFPLCPLPSYHLELPPMDQLPPSVWGTHHSPCPASLWPLLGRGPLECAQTCVTQQSNGALGIACVSTKDRRSPALHQTTASPLVPPTRAVCSQTIAMGHSWELECEFWNAAESGLCFDGRALITKFPLCKQPPGGGCPTGEREGLSLSAVALCGMIMHGWNIVVGSHK